MRKGLTEIVLVLDRSGSMETIRKDAEGGLRNFIASQRVAPGEARLTFYRFDDEIERVFEDRDIRWINEEELALKPRGWTALLDAMGRAINEVGARLANRREEDRPEHVVFLTVTDGEENRSREFDSIAIRKLIDRQRSTYNWNFVFIGATEESIRMAKDLGYSWNNILANNATGRSYQASYAAMVSNVTAMRAGGGAQSLSFTASQRKNAKEEDDNVVITTTDSPSNNVTHSSTSNQ